MAALLLGNLGSSLLGPLGGWIGSAIGSMVDTMLFSPKPEDQKGPRLEDLNVTRADPGVPIPLVFGADRIPGIVVASTPLIETKNKEKVGGKGGPKQTVITYTYHVTIDYMLCEGPVLGVGRIWAEGNLVRGTRYEMDTDTAENPENIGGIPYPSYYKDHLYDPKLIPWSIERTYSDSDEGVTYSMTPNHLAMYPINETDAAGILANTVRVLYWRDTDTGYYIPLYANDHAYSVSTKPKRKKRGLNILRGAYAGSTGEGSVLSEGSTITFIDLAAALDDDTLNSFGDTAEVHLDVEGQSSVWNDEFFGFNVAARVLNMRVDFYADGDETTVDGRNVGEHLEGGYWQWSIGGSNAPKDKHISSRTSTFGGGWLETGQPAKIPTGTRFIKLSTERALTYGVFAGGHDWTGAKFNFLFKDKRKDEEDVRNWPDYWNLYDAINDWSSKAVLTFKGADNVTVYHGTMDQLPNTAMRDALAIELVDTLEEGEEFEIPAYIGRAHVVFDTLQLADYGNRIPNLTFETVQYDDARIAMVLKDMMQRAEVDETYYDLSALPSAGLSSHVLGYSIGTKTTYRAAMETIMEAFRVDAAEIGNTIVFRPRDREVEWVIEWPELSAVESGKSPNELVELSYRDKLEMPKSLTVRFKDVERGYNVNTAQYARQQVPSTQDSLMELAAVIPPAEAKKYARDKMRDVWLERVAVKISLPHKYVYVYPTDIVKISGAAYGRQDIVFKVVKATRGTNGIIELEGVLRSQTLYVPDEGEVTSTRRDNMWVNRPRPVVTTPIATEMFFLDIAPLRESDAIGGLLPLAYYGAMSGDTGWRGAGIYMSSDAGESYSQVLTWADRSVVGQTVYALPYHNPSIIDETNYMDVDLLDATDDLETITFDQLIAGFNYCQVGKETMQFMTAERLEGYTNRWRLTTLVRGRRGTDSDVTLSGHDPAENFIMLETSKTFLVPQPAQYANQEQLFKIVPFGSNLADVEPTTFVNTGNFKRPFAPVFIHGVRDIDNNVSIRWIRQDKVGWGWYEGQDAYDTESTWDYVVEILPPTTGDTPVRTITMVSSSDPHRAAPLVYEGIEYAQAVTDFGEDFMYTAAQQTADGYTPGDPVRVVVYKTFNGGRGHPGYAEV